MYVHALGNVSHALLYMHTVHINTVLNWNQLQACMHKVLGSFMGGKECFINSGYIYICTLMVPCSFARQQAT